ncbi:MULTISPECIES: MBL fold metallo-hydrolase [Bacillaceae]|uniref:MBL fold metallo-hydrolase n=1 Tax=Evansella alkalicola TaxID=745819 RepID=A0ABS6K0Q2_9BACI|nr:MULTISPECIES: MBL fold metallo-hydrolase [Bacillaceae]MBU9723886.1 MBL fold metallo-hydrolase [Bacillus alkalicola]
MSQCPLEINKNTFLIDGLDLNTNERTGSYVLDERGSGGEVTIIETGPSISVQQIIKGLERLNIPLNDVKHIIVTHIHLDHAGGAGLLLESCPNANVLVHPRGLRHLHNPSRLIQGAKAVYGDAFDDLFNPIVPIENNKLREMNHLEELQIGPNRKLLFLHTPGHAKHHFTIHDSLTNICYTGDTIGICYQELYRNKINFYLPSTSPNQFDPDEMLQSVDLIESLHPEYIAFGHYGVSTEPAAVFEQIRYWVPIFVSEGRKVFDNGDDWGILKDNLFHRIQNYLQQLGIESTSNIYESIQLDITISAMGIIDYLQRTQK